MRNYTRKIIQKKCAHGIGTFANTNIPADTIILREKIHNIHEPKNDEYRFKLIKHLLATQKKKFLQLIPHETIDVDYEPLRQNHLKHLPNLTENEMKLYYEKIKRNIFGFGNRPGILFRGTRMNHSCNPNVTYYKDADHMVFRTTRDIPAKSEILDSYIDYTLPRSKRQFILKDRYGFDCGCEKCRK